MTTPWWGSLDKMSLSLVCWSYVRNSNHDDWIIDPIWSKLFDSITHPLCHSLYQLQMHMSKCMYIDQCMYWLFSSRDVVVLLIHKLHNFTVWMPSWSWHNHHGLYLYRGLNKLICFLRKCPPIYWDAYLSTRTCFHGLSPIFRNSLQTFTQQCLIHHSKGLKSPTPLPSWLCKLKPNPWSDILD